MTFSFSKLFNFSDGLLGSRRLPRTRSSLTPQAVKYLHMSASYKWPSRFVDLKREIISTTTPERLTAAWNDILAELATRTAEIAQAGPDVSLPFVGSAMTAR